MNKARTQGEALVAQILIATDVHGFFTVQFELAIEALGAHIDNLELQIAELTKQQDVPDEC